MFINKGKNEMFTAAKHTVETNQGGQWVAHASFNEVANAKACGNNFNGVAQWRVRTGSVVMAEGQ